MSHDLEGGHLALGMEIRDKVTNYVGERIKVVQFDNNKLHDTSHILYIVKRGDAMCQGVFLKYLTVDDEEDINKKRTSDK